MSSERVWVRSHAFQCAPACQGHCQYYPLKDALDASQELLGRITGKENAVMSSALWCDRGEHAFSARDIKRTRITQTTVDPDSGQEVNVPMDICGPCSDNFTLRKPVAAIQSVPAQTSQPAPSYQGGDGAHDVSQDRIYRPDTAQS